jgi:hypothetical protein
MTLRKLLTIWGLAALAIQARADNPAMQGVFVNPSQSDAGIKAAIDAAAREFNFVTRPIARSRLKKHNPVLHRVEVKQGTAIEITLADAKPSAHTPGQPPVKWTRPDGEVFDVTMAWQGATLIQTFKSEEGTRVNRFSLSPDGNVLSMDVSLSGPYMQREMKYMLTFKRQ